MSKSLNQYMSKIPMDIGKEIMRFIIPCRLDVRFCEYLPSTYHCNYSDKYQVAYGSAGSGFSMVHRIKNQKKMFLSRISKKNGKHRYYITTEKNTTMCSDCETTRCNLRYCRGNYIHETSYTSTYVGKDLDHALLLLFTQS